MEVALDEMYSPAEANNVPQKLTIQTGKRANRAMDMGLTSIVHPKFMPVIHAKSDIVYVCEISMKCLSVTCSTTLSMFKDSSITNSNIGINKMTLDLLAHQKV